MQLQFEHGDNYIIIRCEEPTRLDALTKDAFFQSVMGVYHPGKAVILDCHNLDYIDSAGISALISLRKRIVQNADRLILVGLHPDLIDLFHISRLHRVFDIIDTLEMALKSLNQTQRRESTASVTEVNLVAQSREGILVLQLVSPDSLIEANSVEFIEKFKHLTKAYKRILLNIDHLKNLDGMGIAALVHLQSHANKQGKELVFIYSSQTLKRLFKMYHVDDLFRSMNSIDEALAEMRKPTSIEKIHAERQNKPPVNRGNRNHAEYVDLQFLHSAKKKMVESL
ncbi:MAG: anti-sigma factor antagonist [candidate division KSB1 bacterium]|nr:anti-sigma factor antagonist [candidate division KSB1 bacterium]